MMIMKRTRTLDVPKFRRSTIKNRTRFGESVYFRFFGSYNLLYLKFLFMWLGCIALDFVIGFRFELLWPMWLLVRHLYESFRVQAFSSSLHYSAFSVFFVCVTATSDLVCYLFIPIQVLLFIASTYVWVQFVYQSTERGICLPSLFLWTLFFVFEYSIRYKFDSAWYLTRGSWITAGLFPSTAESVSVGSSSGSSSPTLSPRLELYRPFAAHCIGFPVVTLGFRVKSFFNKWRMRIRKEEVMRQNEFFERILAEAVPTTFENRRHFISSRHYLTLEQDAIDYEISSALSDSNASLENNRFYSQAPMISTTTLPPSSLPICSTASIISNQQQQQLPLGTTAAQLINRKCHKSAATTTAKAISATMKTAAMNGGGHASGYSSSGVPQRRSILSPSPMNSASLLSRKMKQASAKNESLYVKLWRLFLLKVLRAATSLSCTALASLYNVFCAPIVVRINNSYQRNFQQQDDLISTSGDGSHVADDESEQELLSYQYGSPGSSNASNTSKKKSRKSHVKGRSQQLVRSSYLAEMRAASTGAALTSSNLLKSTCIHSSPVSTSLHPLMASSVSNGQNGLSPSSHLKSNGHYNGTVSEGKTPENIIYDKSVAVCNGGSGEDEAAITANLDAELKQLCKEKESLEQSLEKNKTELKSSRSVEIDLRSQLSQAKMQERSAKNDLAQTKTKLEQLDAKCKQLTKQNENYKTNISSLEKRMSEMQVKKLELERELNNERLQNAKLLKEEQLPATTANKSSSSNTGGGLSVESSEQFKTKIFGLDREVKSLEREIRSKDELNTKLEDEIKHLRNVSKQVDEEAQTRRIDQLRRENFLLEQTLSSENRLKQDLFRALNEAYGRLRNYEQTENKETKDDSGVQKLSQQGSPSGLSQLASSYSVPQKADTPPPLSVAKTLNLDQLMQATGAQNMAYSFAPLDQVTPNGSSAGNSSSNSDINAPFPASDLLIIGSHRMNNFSALVNSNSSPSSVARTN